ncbi:hypothetical protein IJ541_07880 [bacterium]|nr:hypothetical protein [bacterium]
MGDPISTKQLGGVTYNANQFTGETLQDGRFKLTAKKTGETLIFGQQPKSVPQEKNVHSATDYVEAGVRMRILNPKIELNVNKGVFYDDNNFSLTDIMGATFSSSKDAVSHVNLNDCQDTKVDLAVNESSWFGDKASIQGGKGNRVILDSQDSAEIGYNVIKGEGTANQKDYK